MIGHNESLSQPVPPRARRGAAAPDARRLPPRARCRRYRRGSLDRAGRRAAPAPRAARAPGPFGARDARSRRSRWATRTRRARCSWSARSTANETAGMRDRARAGRGSAPAGTRAVAAVDSSIPTASPPHRRQNARGVDLNRNFPWHWRPLGRKGDQHVVRARAGCRSRRRGSPARLVRRIRPAGDDLVPPAARAGGPLRRRRRDPAALRAPRPDCRCAASAPTPAPPRAGRTTASRARRHSSSSCRAGRCRNSAANATRAGRGGTCALTCAAATSLRSTTLAGSRPSTYDQRREDRRGCPYRDCPDGGRVDALRRS